MEREAAATPFSGFTLNLAGLDHEVITRKKPCGLTKVSENVSGHRLVDGVEEIQPHIKSSP